MMTTIEKDAAVSTDPYSRPNAQFVEDGALEVRASAVGDCRRALWYAATGASRHEPARRYSPHGDGSGHGA